MKKVFAIIASVLLIFVFIFYCYFHLILPKQSIPDSCNPFEKISINSTLVKPFVLHGFTCEKPEYNDIVGKTTYNYKNCEINGLKADINYTFHITSLCDCYYIFEKTINNKDIMKKLTKTCDESLPKSFAKKVDANITEYMLDTGTCFETIAITENYDNVTVDIDYQW